MVTVGRLRRNGGVTSSSRAISTWREAEIPYYGIQVRGSMKCNDVRRCMVDVQGSLDDTFNEELQTHMHTCEPCRSFVDSLRQAEIAMQSLGPSSIPEGLAGRLARQAIAAVKARPSYSQTLMRLAWPFAGAAVASVVLAFVVLGGSSQSSMQSSQEETVMQELASVRDAFYQTSYAVVGGR